jgi:hypothetical protein
MNTIEKMTAGGICRKLSEAQSILTLLANDLGQEIENGNDYIGLNIYHRALQSAQDLISPCLDSLSEHRETAPMPQPGNPQPSAPAIANGNPLTATELKLTLEEIYYRLYSLEAALQTAYQAFPQVCEAPIANAVETVKLIAGLVCAEAERLDLLTHRL